jgi:cell division protease FtsH
MTSSQKTMAFWALAIVVAFIGVQFYQQKQDTYIKDFDNNKFHKAVDAGKVESVTWGLETHHVEGVVKDEFVKELGGKKFSIAGNTSDEELRYLRNNNITPNYENNQQNNYLMILFNWLPMLFIVGLLVFLFRQIQSGGGKAMSFGKSRAKLLTENKTKVTFKEVAGVEEAKEELKEIVSFLKDPKKYTRLGGKIPKGVLMVGPPGTGKTLLARAVAGEAGVPFFTISGSDFVEMFVGVGASRVRDLFEQGKKNAPCIIFIDEIDAVGRHRGAGMGGGHDEREQTLNQMLVEMDGFESSEGVILIAATNRPDVLDPALLRPGRFDRRVMVSTPDINGREKIFEVHAKKIPLASNVDLKKIARGTPGFSGADLANLVNEAALCAARNDRNKVTMEDFEYAKDKVMMGSERRSMVINDEDKKITAYHEAGHALVGKFIKGTDPVHKVTIIPRGMALGLTHFLPEKDSLNLSKSKAESMIAMLFGGRVAEELIFNDCTTGAGNDIERATGIARRMVCEWGMSEKLGPLTYGKSEGPVFMGMQSGAGREYSDSKAEQIDEEVHHIVMDGYLRAKRILKENMNVLHEAAKALLEFETIDGEHIELLANGGTVDDIRRRIKEHEVSMAKEQLEEGNRTATKASEREELIPTTKGGGIGDPDPVTA